MKRSIALKGDPGEFSSSFPTLWGHKVGFLQPRRGLSPTQPCWHPHFELPASRTLRKKILLFTNHSVYGNLLQHPELVQFSSVSQLCPTLVTPWISARQASLSITNSQSPPKPMSVKSVMPSNHLIFCRPLLLLPSVFPSIRVFSSESALHVGWPKYWSFGFSISPSGEYSGLISFRIDWSDPLVVQGTVKSLLQPLCPVAQSYLTLCNPMDCSPPGSSVNSIFLTCIQISQEAGQVVWYSHLSEFSTVYCDPHSQRLWHSQ